MIRPHYVPLYQGICHSEKMADLREKDARFFFCALLTYCDSYGRMDARPRTIHSKVWAMFGTPESVPKLLADLERVGLIVRYEHAGQPVLAIPDWEEKAGKVGRSDRRGESSYPPPPARGTTPAASVVNDSSCQTTPASRARLDPIRSDPSLSEPSQAFVPEDEPRVTVPSIVPASKPKKEPVGEHQEFIAWWQEAFLKATGAPYSFQGAKDGANVKLLLQRAGGDPEALRSRAMILLHSAPAWIAEGGKDLGTLVLHWNKLVSQGTGVASGAKLAAISSVNRMSVPSSGLLDMPTKPTPRVNGVHP